MRLVCPNCDAQYEVDDRVIPDNGRDVQCSNCAHTWFQEPASRDQGLADDLGQHLPHGDERLADYSVDDTENAFAEHDGDTAQTPEFDAPVAQAAAGSPEDDIASFLARHDGGDPGGADHGENDAASQPADQHPDEPAAAPASGAPSLRRRPLDNDVADILREEAAHEANLRRKDVSEPAQPQEDLGLEAPEKSRTGLLSRMARLRGQDDFEVPTKANTAKRRDLLPDVEEINSSLRSTADRHDDTPMDEVQFRRKRSGFRRGLLWILILSALAYGVYIMAPEIAVRFPQAEPYLVKYVEWANAARAQTTVLLGELSVRLGGLLDLLEMGD